MHVDILESRDTARSHAEYISQAPISKEGTIIDGTSDLVFWTDASKQRDGRCGAALVFQTVDKHGRVVWKDATFGVSGQRDIHDAELLAIIYALWVAQYMCPRAAGSRDENTTDRAGGEQDSSCSQDEPYLPRMKKVRIMSDSQTALRWISRKKMPSLTKVVEILVRRIEQCGFLVEFRWVPGHSVPGNRFADRLADAAAKQLAACQKNGRKAKKGTYIIWPDRNRGMVKKATLECVRLGNRIRTNPKSVIELGHKD
ncbi:hypothetical protein N0V82_006127 [Gnomoniopsis sp. IMI 355080]|nr:hypothetical protein N0V82_006127 [Gnomoniopsis sp. IMI 355080]